MSSKFSTLTPLDLKFVQNVLKRLFCPLLASRMNVPLAQALTTDTMSNDSLHDEVLVEERLAVRYDVESKISFCRSC